VSGVGTVLRSSEFKALGRRILQTDPIGTLPRWSMQQFPALERGVRRLVKADGSLPVYHRAEKRPEDVVHMGSGGALISIEKAQRVLGYAPVVDRQQAMDLTLAWIRHARLA
jgi:hypothetical protein